MKAVAILFLSFFTLISNSHADEIYQQSAVDLCQNLKQKSYKDKCLKQVKTFKFNETALAYCANVGAWNKTKTCLEAIKNQDYQEQPLSICLGAKYYNNDLKKCLKEIAGKTYVSEIEVNLCKQEKTFKKQVTCLKAASSKPYEAPAKAEDQNDASLAEIQTKVKEAYKLLRENKTADATILLHDLVTSFDKK